MELSRRVLSLIRVSGKPQIDRTGIPRQLETIAEICKEHNLRIEKGDEYRFEGLSGASVDRFPRYMEMLQRLSDRNIAGIVFSEVSRLFRPEFVDQLGISKSFRVNGKLMWYEDGVLDLRKDRDQGIFISESQKAGAHRKRIIKWTQWGRTERRKHGDCKTDPIPQGVKFIAHPKTKDELVTGYFAYTHDIYSDRIKEAFRRVLAGECLNKIARELKFGKAGKPNPNVLRNNLRSRWWIGEKASFYRRVGYGLRDDGTLYSGEHVKRDEPVIVTANFNEEPLISRDDFFAVQRILDDTGKTWIHERAISEDKESPLLGKGVLTCDLCGMKLYTKPFIKNGKRGYYYRCSSNNGRHEPCGAPHLNQEMIDAKLQQWATKELQDPEYIESLNPIEPAVQHDLIENQIAEMEKTKKTQYARIGKVKDQALLDKLIEETESQIEKLQKELTAQPVRKSKFDRAEVLARFGGFGVLARHQQRKVLRGAFRRIVMDRTGKILELELTNGTVVIMLHSRTRQQECT